MPTTIPTTTSSTRPGSPSAGDAYFETDTKNYIIYDGANWRVYNNDGVSGWSGTNTYSVDFDGVDDYLDLGSSDTLFNSASAFSISAWVNLDGYSPDTFPSICVLKTDQSTGWMLGLSNFSTSYGGVWMGSSANFAGLTTGDLSLATSLVGGWHHIVVTFDGVSRTTASSFALYIDGVSKTLTASGTFGTTPNTNQIGFGNGNNTRFNGNIDEVAIFTSELSSSQVTNIYKGESNGGSGGTNGTPGNLLSFNPSNWWRMGDGAEANSGSTVYDMSLNNVNGTLTNGASFESVTP